MAIDVKEAALKRERLHKVILAVLDAAQRFKEITGDDNSETQDKLSGLAESAATDAFKILVVGEFKNGKSTFINALLSESVLPNDILPCTAVISEVVYGEDKGATLHFENPLPEVISEYISPKTREHIDIHKDDPGGVPPLDVTFEELGSVVTIPEDELLGKVSAAEGAETQAGKDAIGKIPFSHAVVRFPLEILRDGVEIIDTPGLNEDTSREEVTRNYLKKADAIVFLFKFPKVLSMIELASLSVLSRVHKDIFFVVNAVDIAATPSELEKVQKFSAAKLIPFTALKEGGIFFTSALKALEAGRKDPAEMKPVEREGIVGMKSFEAALSEYLSVNKATAKLASLISKVTPCIKEIDDSSARYIETFTKILQENKRRIEQEIASREKVRAERRAELAKFSEDRKRYTEELQKLTQDSKKFAEEAEQLKAEAARLKADASSSAEAKKKYNEELRKFREERKRLEEQKQKLTEENMRLHSELQSLTDKSVQLDREADSCADELEALRNELEELRSKLAQRSHDANSALSEAETQRRKITDKLIGAEYELNRKINSAMSFEYDYILSEIPSFVRNMKPDHEIGFFDALFGTDDAKRALASEIMEKLKDFFDRNINDWSGKDLKELIENFMKSLRDDIKPGVTGFYEHIDKCSTVLNDTHISSGSNTNALSRLDNVVNSMAFGRAGYSTSFLMGDAGAFSDLLLGDIITEIFGTSIFSSVLHIGDALLSTVYNLITFWQMSDRATNAQKKAVSDGFRSQMTSQKSAVCSRYADEVSGMIVKELQIIDRALNEEISRQRMQVQTAENAGKKEAEFQTKAIDKKKAELAQKRKQAAEAKTAEDLKRVQKDQQSEDLKEAAEQTKLAQQQEREQQSRQAELERKLEASRTQAAEVHAQELAAQTIAQKQAESVHSAEERAQAAEQKEAQEKKKLEDEERIIQEQNDKANAELKALQADMLRQINGLQELQKILQEQKIELAEQQEELETLQTKETEAENVSK